MFGNLPDVVLIISDDRLVKLLELLNSIPRPDFDEEVVDLSAPIEGTKLRDRAKMVAIMEVSELDENVLLKDNEEGEDKTSSSITKTTERKSDSDTSSLHRELQIQLDINLSLNEVGIVVNKRDKAFLSAHICRLGFHLRKRMFDMIAKAHLGSLTLEMPQFDSSGKAQTICLIDNEMREGDHLIDMVYKQDVLNDLKNFSDRLQRKLANIKPPQIEQASPQTAGGSRRRTPSMSSRSREGSLDRKTSGKKRSPLKPEAVRLTNKKKFVFDFRMHEIAAKLYARQGDIAGGIDLTEDPDAILEFCALNIRNFKLDGSMVDDGSMHADISLQAFTMDDRRKNATIHRLMDKKDTKSTDQFVTVKYSQNNHGDKFVDLLSSKFFLMLAPEFLGVLSTFFILKPDEEDDEKNGPSELFLTPNSNNSKLALSKQYVSTSSMAKQALATKGTPEQSTFEPPGTLTLNCKVYAIEIILIEDSLNPSNSQAIILSFDALLDAKNLNGVQQMDGGIQHFKIYSTYFAKEKRHLSNYQILKEMDICFNGSIDDKEHTQNFSVKIDQVTLRVSPSIIRLLSAVSAQFSEHQRKDQEAKSARAILREYQDYWKPRVIENDKYWWFQLGNDSLVEETAEEVGETTQIAVNQKADFSIKQFIVTVEAGMKDFTRPMILLESAMLGSAKNWSTQLIAEAEARLQISYYNEAFNVWEPLIEPVLHQYEGWQSWRLTLKISSQLDEDSNSQQRQGTSKTKDKINQKKAVLPPKMALIFEAREMMNITSFEKAAKQISPPKSRQLPGSSNYMLLNETGLEIKICNTSTLKASQNQKELECNKGEFIPLQLIENENQNGSEKQLSSGNWQMKEDQRHVELQLKIEEPKTERIVNILRAEMQCIDLPKEADSGRKWALVVDTQLEDSRHLVVLRSPVNIINRMDMSVEFQSHKDLETTFCGVSAIDNRPLNIPLPQLYTPDGEFSIRPEGGVYDWSELFSWHEFDNVKRKTVRCGKKGVEHEAIFIEMVVTEDKIRRGAKSSEYSIYTIHLFPPIHFVNLLPLCLEITEPIRREVTSGDGVDLYNLIAGMTFILKLENGGEVYTMKMNIPEVGQRNDLTVIKLLSETSNKELCLGLNWSIEFLRTTLSLFTPYWMVNDTGKELTYQGPLEKSQQGTPHSHHLRASIFGECCTSILPKSLKEGEKQAKRSEIKHLPNQNPIILPLNEEDFYEKKKAKLRISDSEWSADFPLDSAGSSGRITCHSDKKDYELTVDVKLCQSGLTKVVTISPFYLLQNDSKYCIEVREPNRNEWIMMPQTSVIGFWPEQKEKRKTLIARFPKTKEESIQFPFTENFEGFARVKNSLIGFYIIVSLSDDSSVINIEQFMPGMVPAILMNATKFPIIYWQAEVEEEKTLEPGQVIPFAWDCLITKETRLFEWKSGDHSGSDELLHNRDSSYLPSKNAGYHFCVSFLNGRQRVVLFTSDASISMLAHEPFEFEQPNMHVEFRLHGVGISLVNNHKCIEVLYMAILPGQGQRDGFWMQYRQTDHQTTLWVKLHNFQIDNQLPSSIFPCMLAMVTQPKSVVKDAPKPFLECSFVMNQSEHSNIVQIKLLEALVQEFSVRMDQSLINEILDLFPKESIETDYNKEAFSKDFELTKGNLNKRALQTRISQAKAYYERLHISPLMIHLSFSQGHFKEGEKGAAVGIQWEFLNLMLKSVGVTLTEIQDVTFKLAFFHREAAFYSRTQLQAEIQSHYIKQFIKQAYVLILGLDIIGNPFGLIRDLTAGVQDFFYQPIQGAVTGPLEFVEGMTLGVNSLFSHSVGGVLGAASRITGTLGKGVAALTMDEEYQRKRLQARQQPTNFGEGMFRGVRGVGQGVIDGVTGVISKPVEGAKKGGVSGFLKGTGKGLIGVVTRPVSGVVDLATSMADSVKTVVTNAEEIKPIRPPRVITNDKIVRPFVYVEAIGYKIFKEINKGDFAETDCYLADGSISKHLVIIVTDKHVIEARQHELTGNWNADWSPTYSEMNKPEWIVADNKYGVKISLKEPRRGTFSLLGRSKTKGKLILFQTEEIAKRVFDRMLSAWENSA
uniref:FSA_C domain-containing protein n=1 Tax=Meloidogyne hapla TaxID=6305 RepID=A0A1I8B4S6_MELHA